MTKLKYKNFINIPIHYCDEKMSECNYDRNYFLSDFKLSKDQDLLCQILGELGFVINPHAMGDDDGAITSICFEIEGRVLMFWFDNEGNLDCNIEEELRLENIEFSEKWKDFYVSKGFTLLTKSEILKI